MNTDSELIRRVPGDAGAFTELYRRHVRVVGAFAARRVGSDAAEDVVAETFLIAFRKVDRFDHRQDSARPWLLGITVKVIARYRAAEAAQWRALAAASDGAHTPPTDSTAQADARVDARAATRALAPAIAQLSSGDRDVLLLHAWGDLTYEQIATALRIPVGTVRSRLNRVRRVLTRAAAPLGSSGAGTLEGVTS